MADFRLIVLFDQEQRAVGWASLNAGVRGRSQVRHSYTISAQEVSGMQVTARSKRSHGARSHEVSSAMTTRSQPYQCPD